MNILKNYFFIILLEKSLKLKSSKATKKKDDVMKYMKQIQNSILFYKKK